MATPPVQKLVKLVDLSSKRDLHGRVSVATVRRRVQRGELPHVRIAGRIFLEAAVLEEFLRGRAVPAEKEAVAQSR